MNGAIIFGYSVSRNFAWETFSLKNLFVKKKVWDCVYVLVVEVLICMCMFMCVCVCVCLCWRTFWNKHNHKVDRKILMKEFTAQKYGVWSKRRETGDIYLIFRWEEANLEAYFEKPLSLFFPNFLSFDFFS